ncbi:hypothetical protein HYPSUDRAFT_860954 [Hypholoma sublateritium FD-334 SS-4]|uniref:YTH domain-containing protein n=1 Tax=Hypholoma sublateritium (strain FD-334 SS-4) TaxID=945553 RepID=A0A0D2PHU8_HYPSF|nr:hypothetical protein HYPSUDRAFT_860954 [Hypholoma sublateritium FD-334 SS-4]
MMNGEAPKQKPQNFDPARPGARSRRSRSNPPQRVPHSSGLESGFDYPSLSHSVLKNENVRDEPPASFIPQPRRFPPPAVLSYDQRSGLVDPHAMPTQSNLMNTLHPQRTYAFAAHQHSIPQDMHTGFQTMLQSHTPAFAYAHSPAEGAHQPHLSSSNAPRTTPYTPHPSYSQQTSYLPSSSSQGGSLYGGSGPLRSLQYPSTTVVPAYNYPPQTYAPTQMYRPPYPTPNFGQQFISQGESGSQLGWYYFPHLSSGPSPLPRDTGPPYQSHYAVGYSKAGHSGMAHSFTSEAAQGRPPEHYSSSSSRYQSEYPPSPGSVPLQHSPPAEEMLAAMPMEGGSPATNDHPLIRRSFHPNPPADRSDWVMWVGNVPADATHDEVWQFFTAAPADASAPAGAANGVVSVFLIARSSCAFVNYWSMEVLQCAIARFNGVPLRANDLSCPRLVCRARKTDDELKAGVGYQRGMGMHTRWVREKLAEGVLPQKPQSAAPDEPSSPEGASASLAGPQSDVSPSSDNDDGKGRNPPHSNSTTSTNSSFLAYHFPIRYFILKSLSQADLDISVSRGIWATQKHNEEILDQAFRTSEEVYLVFGVNKSKEFYGYARMTGPVLRSKSDVQWTSRSPHHSPNVLAGQIFSQPGAFFSPGDHRLVDSSPLAPAATSAGDAPDPIYERHSAPALIGDENRKQSPLALTVKPHSVDQQRLYLKHGGTERLALDTSAPGRAIRGHEVAPGMDEPNVPTCDLVHEEDIDNAEAEEETNDLATPLIQPGDDIPRGEVSWGDSFAVEWLCKERLSFNRTRHLRNSWNRDKEIKVSRDGTELEPSVGRQLLQDWGENAGLPSSPVGAPGRTPLGSSGRRRPSTKSEYPLPIMGGGDRLPTGLLRS